MISPCCANCKWHTLDTETWTGRRYCTAVGGKYCGEWTEKNFTCETYRRKRAPDTGTIQQRVAAGDWHGMTMQEIADELEANYSTVWAAIDTIQRETGQKVDYKRQNHRKGANQQ